MYLFFKSNRQRLDTTKVLEWVNSEIEHIASNTAGAVIITLKSETNKEFIKQAMATLKSETNNKIRIYYNEKYNKISVE